MRGAIIGDIIGSAFIDSPQPSLKFQLLKPFSAYTDDTVLTISTADAILSGKPYCNKLRQWTQHYPKAGYQPAFLEWALSNNPNEIYKSKGDGAARRISPIGFAATTLDEAMEEARKATIVTHPDEAKITASQALCGSIFLAKSGKKKSEIRDFLCNQLGYELPETLTKECATILNERYQSPVPCAIMAVLVSDNFENAIRHAIWIDGPSNTLGSITGAVAQAYYKHIPKSIIRKSLARLSPELEDILSQFENKYCQPFLIDKKEIQFNFH
ncbi:ADP-ribosylglycohydrolase family protein [Carboxylicivirga marina]|uniref:ADP-ribosylglycohydrolase family protein n=1 Tax=Carboxylicivirga marina TaxID=2800988 RepID=A0ABS1HIW8_9BACT|nr:ADP-ribosylglycohydrolase family protein [Carboxylicivirga marina]MBK3517243.1 ADP-ribosylglycohydrolase family protein [Carboxylicivirga marina]